jgi:hypothetical protein
MLGALDRRVAFRFRLVGSRRDGRMNFVAPPPNRVIHRANALPEGFNRRGRLIKSRAEPQSLLFESSDAVLDCGLGPERLRQKRRKPAAQRINLHERLDVDSIIGAPGKIAHGEAPDSPSESGRAGSPAEVSPAKLIPPAGSASAEGG